MSEIKTILLVDDDEDVRLMCEKGLRNDGYATHSVSSGLEALQFMETSPKVDLIVLDIKMAPFDGIELLKRLRAKRVSIPVILYSDYSLHKANFNTWLADAYVMKSSDLRELKKKVKQLLTFQAGKE